MATPIDPLVPRDRTCTWSEVDCRTILCQRCKNVPFDEGAFDGTVTASDTPCESLHLYPSRRQEGFFSDHDTLKIDFELLDDWPQLPVIAKSAENCDFCRLLETRLRKTELPLAFQHAWIRVELYHGWCEQHDYGLIGLKALVRGKVKEEDQFTSLVWLTFSIDAYPGECKRWLRLQQRPPSEFLSGENISKITARLKKLNDKRMSAFLPTRLVDLGCHGKPWSSGRLVTKEEAFNEHCTYPMYVALSYPWGSREQAAYQSKTTPENIHERMTNIDLQDVSKVIQDAARACKLLGVRYLWVDALCIIQGDIQDWERESTIMGNIFRNAYLTIAAAAIESCHESFLSQNVDTLEIPFASRIKPRVKGTYRLVSGSNEYGKFPCLLRSENVASGPWETRGWVFQELTMSTRLWVFRRTMMTLETLEEGREELPSWFNVFKSTMDHSSWRHLVESYSCRRLTFAQDRFPAISGLARLFADHLEDQYLAGIWKNDIFISLFWYSAPLFYLERHSLCALVNIISSRPYIAPSWSWAAGKNFFEFAAMGLRPAYSEYQTTSECKVFDAECIVQGLDPFGVVQTGHIVLSAKVLRLEKGKFSFEPTRRQMRHHDWCVNGTSVMQTLFDGYPEMNDPDIHRVLFLLLGSCVDIDSHRDVDSGDDAYPDEERSAYGLLLYPVQGANTFYRVGLFSSSVSHARDGGLKFCRNWKTEEITII